MPWHESDVVIERSSFIGALDREGLSMSEACRRFGVSRKTGYKILRRYEEHGTQGLKDRSSAPHSHPNRTPAEVESAILQVRKDHPTWGSKKILVRLERTRPELDLPARSTVDAMLKRVGLVSPRRKRVRRQPSRKPVVEASKPNDVWTMDYKGWFRVGDGTRCDPLTVNDMHSRASLVLRAMVEPKLPDVKRRLEEAFHQHGLPSKLLSDNGPPFAAAGGLGRLSRLSVWLLRLDVLPVLIEPGHPEQNGRHERFHETLKADAVSPPCTTIRTQQNAFDRFQSVYNEQRPHEALDMRVPSDVYEPSPRQMPKTLPDHDYPDGFEVRRVRRNGTIKWSGATPFIGEAIADEHIGMERVGDESLRVHLGPLCLGILHERTNKVVPLADGPSVTQVPGHE